MKRGKVFPEVKAENLKRGDVVSVWDWDNGDASVVQAVEVFERPGMKYNGVKLTMKNGDSHKVLIGTKFSVLKIA